MSTSSPFLPSSLKLSLEGVLLIDKPMGCTSHDVVDRVRRKLGLRQVGHAGTLDPLATGLLILLIGKATKLSQYLISLDKTYEGTLKLGETTDTYDREGTVLVTMPVPSLTEATLKAEMQSFVKDQYQIPPMFSAKKVAGTPLYKMARKGLVIEREPRFISIYEFQLTQLELPNISFLLRCSKGTYVRTVAHDLGAKMGCGAHLINLKRTTSGNFKLEQALTLEAFEQGSLSFIKSHLISAAQAVPVGGIIG